MPRPPAFSIWRKNFQRGFLILVVIDDHRRAGPGQPLGRRRADAATRAGDERNFTVEVMSCLSPATDPARLNRDLDLPPRPFRISRRCS